MSKKYDEGNDLVELAKLYGERENIANLQGALMIFSDGSSSRSLKGGGGCGIAVSLPSNGHSPPSLTPYPQSHSGLRAAGSSFHLHLFHLFRSCQLLPSPMAPCSYHPSPEEARCLRASRLPAGLPPPHHLAIGCILPRLLFATGQSPDILPSPASHEKTS